MNVVNFIVRSQNCSFFKNVATINFFGAEVYPLLFFSTIVESIKKNSSLSIQTINWADQSDAQIAASLKTLFLGMRMAYWLGNLEDLEAARKKKWSAFLVEYSGPHLVLFYTKGSLEIEQSNNVRNDLLKEYVEVPSEVNKATSLQLLNLYYPEYGSRNQAFVSAIFARTDVISLDQLDLLKQYGRLIGKNQNDFIDQWLNLLIIPEKSLFTLSQYFFAQESQKFFALWATIASDYPAAFWVVFWSEQLFRACNYVQLMNQRKGADAKRIAFRLPFSFMQRDWRLYTVQKLRDAHTTIYQIDFSIKNGGSENALDLFYSRFFQKDLR